jgi:hypothetical protein
MMPATLQRFRLLVQELGVATTLLYLMDRLLRRINNGCSLYYYHFVTQPLADKPRLPPTRGKAFAFRLLQTPEPVLGSLDRPPVVINERFIQGAQCLVATKNEVLVGCIWFIRGAYVE